MKNSTIVLLNYPGKPFEAPQPYLLYVGFDMAPDQQQAVVRLLANEYRLRPSQGVKLATINSHFNRAWQKVSIPGILEYEITAPNSDANMRLDSEVSSHLYSWLVDPEQWSVRRVMLSVDHKTISYEGTNSIVAKLANSQFKSVAMPERGSVSEIFRGVFKLRDRQEPGAGCAQ